LFQPRVSNFIRKHISSIQNFGRLYYNTVGLYHYNWHVYFDILAYKINIGGGNVL